MPSLNNLQLFILPHTESLTRASTTSARLYFLAGPRLIAFLGGAHGALSATAGTLSSGAPDVPARVEQVVEDRRRATKRVEDLEAELANVIAHGMVATALHGAQDNTKPVVLHKHREDDTSNPLGFLSSISSAFVSEIAAHAQPVSYLVVLSSSPSAQTVGSTSVVMVFGDDEKRVKAVGGLLKAKLGVKGGGKGTKWSGKFTGVWKASRESVLVDEALQD